MKKVKKHIIVVGLLAVLCVCEAGLFDAVKNVASGVAGALDNQHSFEVCDDGGLGGCRGSLEEYKDGKYCRVHLAPEARALRPSRRSKRKNGRQRRNVGWRKRRNIRAGENCRVTTGKRSRACLPACRPEEMTGGTDMTNWSIACTRGLRHRRSRTS